jgi:hypothetical protein
MKKQCPDRFRDKKEAQGQAMTPKLNPAFSPMWGRLSGKALMTG